MPNPMVYILYIACPYYPNPHTHTDRSITSFDQHILKGNMWTNMGDGLQQKSVRFSTRDDIQEIPGLDTYSEEELQNVWYSKLDEMRRRAQIIMSRKRSTVVDDKRYGSIEELETREEASERRVRIREARLAVFMEQQLQWESDSVDEEMISGLYSATTRFSALEARKRALFVAMEVQEKSLFKRFGGVDCREALTRSVKEDILANALRYRAKSKAIFVQPLLSRLRWVTIVGNTNENNAVCPMRQAIDTASKGNHGVSNY